MDRRILIADDDLDVRQGAAELLTGIGLDVIEAENGTQALEVVRASYASKLPLHLALVDVHMPGPIEAQDHAGLDGGLALFGLLRDSSPELPCILWSGEASDAVAKWVLDAGASAFLRKPVKPAELRLVVRDVLERHWCDAG